MGARSPARLPSFGAGSPMLPDGEDARASGTANMGNREGLACAPAADAAERPIDQIHLCTMTLGDRRLQREVLELFDRQIALLLERMRHVEAAGVRTLAHTLKGSARGVGAWKVARAAEALELAEETARMRDAFERLAGAADEARAAIGLLLGQSEASPTAEPVPDQG